MRNAKIVQAVGRGSVVASCILLSASRAHADVVIGNWEQQTDGWGDWTFGPTDLQDDPQYTYSSTTGVTLGSYSLKWQLNTNGNNIEGYYQGLCNKLEFNPSPDLPGGQSEVSDFLDNTRISFDITYNTADWTGPGTYAVLHMFLNASGMSWTDLGQPTIDTGNAGYPGGWDPTDYPGITTRTMTWDYTSDLALTTSTPTNGYVELGLISEADSNFNTGAYYIDNVRFTAAVSWNSTGPGNWGAAANWSSSIIPKGSGDVATFGSAITAPTVVTLDSSRTVGEIFFSNANSYTISGAAGAVLTIDDTGDASGSNPQINVSLGSQSINAPITLANGVSLTTAAGTSLTLGGAISGTGPLSISGTVILGGANTYSGNTTVPAGSSLNVTGSLPAGTTLKDTGNVTLAAHTSGIQAQTIGTITLSGAGKLALAPAAASANRTVLLTSALNLAGSSNAWQGLLDLGNGDAIVHNGNLAALTNQIDEGFHGGTWTGTAGITSSSAALSTNTALGIESGGLLSSFDGQPVTSTDVLIKYTYFGDANLDGVVNGSDYTLIDNGFNNSLTGWHNGDFNYDGVVNGDDYTLIDNAFNTQGPSLAATSQEMLGGQTSQIEAGSSSAVPEPAALGITVLSGVALLRRRRHSVANG